jgi:hypothetical protein
MPTTQQITKYMKLINKYGIPILLLISLIQNDMRYIDNGFICCAIYNIFFETNCMTYAQKSNLCLYIILNRIITFLFENIFGRVLNLLKLVMYCGLYSKQITCDQIMKDVVRIIRWIYQNHGYISNNILDSI